MAHLELVNITKRFPGTLAVDDLSLAVEEGEFLVLLGPSGCGKTTTLRIIAGLEVQTEGQVILEGVDVSDLPPERRDMAMVFQNLALYPHMTVFNNIAFYLQNIKAPRTEQQARVEEAARRVEIEGLLDRYPDQLSGGQRQRVALARALVRSPKVFLLDEPLAALDAKLRASMRSEFKLLHRSLAQEQNGLSGTFIYVTHDQVEALTLGTRIAVINEGRLVQLATPLELYNQPNHLFTATFIGSPEMNLVPGELRWTADRACFAAPGIELLAGEKGRQALAQATGRQPAVTVGFRPEAVRLVATDAPHALPAKIISVELIGQSNLILFELAGTVFTCLASSDEPVREGAGWGLEIKPESLHFFDASTGENLLAGGV